MPPVPRSPQDRSHARPPAGADPGNPTPEFLLWAYRHAIFPMAEPVTGRIEWFSPDPRAILPLDPPEAIHIPKNVARLCRRGVFEIRSDTAFEEVINACARPRSKTNQSWLNERMIGAYVALFRRGHVHSVEAWREGKLVGGLYGVQIGAAFFGESMFVRPSLGGSNSSKLCLVHLVHWLRKRGFTLLDTQFWNPHVGQFGCVEIPAAKYEVVLAHAVAQPVTWGEFETDIP